MAIVVASNSWVCGVVGELLIVVLVVSLEKRLVLAISYGASLCQERLILLFYLEDLCALRT